MTGKSGGTFTVTVSGSATDDRAAETQDTQETLCNYDIYYPDDLTSDDADPCSMAECTGCSLLLIEVTGGQPRLCASCRYYAQCE